MESSLPLYNYRRERLYTSALRRLHGAAWRGGGLRKARTVRAGRFMYDIDKRGRNFYTRASKFALAGSADSRRTHGT